MLISKALFRSRAGRVLLPLTCLALAVAAVAAGGQAGPYLAAGLALLAVLFKIAAETSGRIGRLEERDVERRMEATATSSSLAMLDTRLGDAASRHDALASRLGAFEATVEGRLRRVDERQEQQADDTRRLTEALTPIRRHRLASGGDLRERSLIPSIEQLADRLRRD